MTYETSRVACSHPGCLASVADHAWGRIKAEGWFFEKAGPAWCPEHHPEWVAEWRARQARKKSSRED